MKTAQSTFRSLVSKSVRNSLAHRVVLPFALLAALAVHAARPAHAVLLGDLENYYRFDDSGDLGKDDSGNNHDGTLNGTPVFALDSERGGVVEYDSNADSINAATDNVTGAGFTISLWANRDGVLKGSGNDGLFVIRDAASSIKTIGGWVSSGNNAWGRIVDTAGSKNLPTSGDPLPDDEWVNVVYRGDGSTYEVFVDGDNSSQASVAYNGTLTNTVDLLELGKQGGESWKGRLDDFGIFTTALSNTEIRAIHSLGTTASIEYDLGEVTELLDAFENSTPTINIDGITWFLVDDGSLEGTPGVVGTNSFGAAFINLGGGNGFTTFVPEPGSALLLCLGLLGILRPRRRTARG